MNFVYATKISPSRGANVMDLIDVSVTVGKKDPKTLRFSFSGQIKEKAFKKDDYIIPAIDTDNPSRIYFFADENGYKLGKGEGFRYYLVPASLSLMLTYTDSYVGDYDLEYDPVCKMWFIDSSKKIKV